MIQVGLQKGARSVASEQQAGGRREAHEHERAQVVINRLARIEGHVRAIKRMVEEGTPCPDLLVQIAAVRSALNGVGRVILEDHIQSCMVDAVRNGNFERAYQSLEQSLDRFIR
jgi:DNA-binding FrmR family transcriptional regulator